MRTDLDKHFQYIENSTRPMQEALTQYLDGAEVMIRQDLELAKQLWQASDVKLPMLTETGESVVHGARMNCWRKAQIFVARAEMLLCYMPRNVKDAFRDEFRDVLKVFK